VDQPRSFDPQWVTASEATDLLGVKRRTLYVYASRRLIRSIPVTGSRERRYSRADIERLRARRDARAGHGPVAAGALRWGEPVLDSAVTGIGTDGPIYRGHLLLTLARTEVPFESVAELLWTGTLPKQRPKWSVRGFGLNPSLLIPLIPKNARPLEALMIAFGAISLIDADPYEPTTNTAIDRATVLARRAVAAFGLVRGADAAREALRAETVSKSFLVALGGRTGRDAVSAVEKALVLVADHELNPSSFAARLPASVGASLAASVAAAIATLSGPIHGGAAERVEAMIDEAESPERAASVVRDRMRRGDQVPGFGHPLYPIAGDPRASPLMRAAQELAPNNQRVRTVHAFAEAMLLAGGPRPTLDLGLVALCAALKLPPGSAVALFAAGRIAGWIAHALEQRSAGFALRPRARYVGPASP
jgi:citrate synthase